jgi:hypothetical protein
LLSSLAPGTWLLFTLLVGCDTGELSTPQANSPLGPEERLAHVMERFRSRCTSSDTTLSLPEEGGGSRRMRVKSEFDSVTYRMQAPTTPDGTYTAEVTVQSSTSISVLIPPEPAAEPTEGEVTEPLPLDPADPAAKRESRKQRPAESPDLVESLPEDIPRRDQDTETYDLAYENDRWVLKSRNIDPSIQLMFDYALDVQ